MTLGELKDEIDREIARRPAAALSAAMAYQRCGDVDHEVDIVGVRYVPGSLGTAFAIETEPNACCAALEEAIEEAPAPPAQGGA